MSVFRFGQRVAVTEGDEDRSVPALGHVDVTSEWRSRKVRVATILAILPPLRAEDRESYLVRFDDGTQAIAQASDISTT
jgi:hypothetical protein